MMSRSAHHAGVTPSVSLTWRNSISMVLVSSSGTIQRLIIGPLNGCSCGRPPRSAPPAADWAARLRPCAPRVVADAAGGDIDHADRGLDELQLRQYAELVGEHRAADDRVQKRCMGRVHRVFHDLQPVARIKIFLARDQPIARPDETVVDRERRPLLGRAHIGEDDAVVFVDRIGAVAQPVLQRAVGRLARGLEDRPVGGEQPAMVAAADPLVVDQAKFQRGAAMRAMQLQQADGAALVAEHDEVLAEDLDPQRQIVQLVGETDRLPEAAQIFAARRAGANMGEFRISRPERRGGGSRRSASSGRGP